MLMVIFLDVPTTGLDPISRLEVWSAIKQLQGNIILTTHYMEEAEKLSEEVFLFESGSIIDRGTIKSLLKGFENKVRIESYRKMDNSFRGWDNIYTICAAGRSHPIHKGRG
jgi:ABC-type multidrug transport system, ATPase component